MGRHQSDMTSVLIRGRDTGQVVTQKKGQVRTEREGQVRTEREGCDL